jgi:hypothetical protein
VQQPQATSDVAEFQKTESTTIVEGGVTSAASPNPRRWPYTVGTMSYIAFVDALLDGATEFVGLLVSATLGL